VIRNITPAADRFAKYVSFDQSGCLLWKGPLSNGYGYFNLGNQQVTQAHRAAWFLYYGEMPKKHLDHLCRVRNCVNPIHLEEVTVLENLMRSPLTEVYKRSSKTACVRGHELSGENLLIDAQGHRQCRKCNVIRCRKHRAAKKERS
jgi:hypothetical protein